MPSHDGPVGRAGGGPSQLVGASQAAKYVVLDPGGVPVFNSSRLRQLGSLSHHPLPDVGVDSQWCDVGVITIPVRVWKARGQDPNC